MGTINIKGHKKLPPSPLCMNEDEIEKFGLEECETVDMMEEEEEEDGVILDIKDEPEVDHELEEAVKTTYLGIRVGDMVKITAKNKFFNEDAVVRRLKNGQLFLRFYTYGSMYEEWMPPGDVRKLTDEEVMKGLSGPQHPITQRDIDGPAQGENSERFGDNRSRRNMVSNFGGDQDRRQGRNAERYERDSDRDTKRNDDNWNAYKDNQRRSQGGFNDGEFEMQGSKENGSEKWTQSDVDSQWGRTSQRQNRREKRKLPASEDADWGSFVSSPGGKDQPSQEETDDFFASLMTDLSNDLGSGKKSKQMSKSDSSPSGYTSSEDDFFASLISEIEDDDSVAPVQKFQSDDEDFFASLAEELGDDSEINVVGVARAGEDHKKASSNPIKKASAADELDSFFSELGALDDVNPDSSSSSESTIDFFAELEAELESQLSGGTPQETISDQTPSAPLRKAVASPVKTIGVTDLGGCTVPELKEMLRERGLKVSGKKSELIERLTSA
jgi:SAP domain